MMFDWNDEPNYLGEQKIQTAETFLIIKLKL